jgi:hypothetical protein
MSIICDEIIRLHISILFFLHRAKREEHWKRNFIYHIQQRAALQVLHLPSRISPLLNYAFSAHFATPVIAIHLTGENAELEFQSHDTC